MTVNKPDIVRAWCLQRVGNPYIYGATGQPCTPSYRQARMSQYPQYAEKIRRNCPRLSGKASVCADCKWCDPETGVGKLAYDCAQLSRWAMAEIGITLVSGANSQWTKTHWQECGSIKYMPTNMVCLVFRQDEDHMGHVGVYQGDGTVIHAKGHDYGVVKQSLNDVNFTHYGIPYGLYEEEPPMTHPTLRKGDTGDEVKYLQTLLTDVGETLAADGKFGTKTENAVKDFQRRYGLVVDGVVGPATWTALEKATGHEEPPAQDEPPKEPAPPTEPDGTDEFVCIRMADWVAIRDAVRVLTQIISQIEGESVG